MRTTTSLVPLLLLFGCGWLHQAQERRSWLGVAVEPDKQGLRVRSLAPGGPIIRAGIVLDDSALNGAPVTDVNDFGRRVATATPGTMMEIRFFRQGREYRTSVQVEAAPPGMPAPNSPATASSSSGTPPRAGVFRLRPASIMDAPNMIGGEAYQVLVPVGWNIEGSMLWFNRPSNPALPRARISNPNGIEEISILPTLNFTWSQMLQPYFPIGSDYLGMEVRPPIQDPFQVIRTLVLPRYRPDLRNARIVGQEELPKLAAAGNEKYPELRGLAQYRGGRVRLEYSWNGRAVEEDVFCLLGWVRFPVGTGYSIIWGADEIRTLRAEKGALDKQYGLFQAVSFSLRPNLSWFARYEQLCQMLAQQQIQQSNAAVAASRQASAQSDRMNELRKYIARSNDHVTAGIRSSYETRQASMDRINHAWSNHIRGVDDYHNPLTGRTVQLPSGYDRGWVNGQGEYIISNDHNYNPNVGDTRSWREMAKPR